MRAPIYGTTCAICGDPMLRGPDDADVCADHNLDTVPR